MNHRQDSLQGDYVGVLCGPCYWPTVLHVRSFEHGLPTQINIVSNIQHATDNIQYILCNKECRIWIPHCSKGMASSIIPD